MSVSGGSWGGNKLTRGARLFLDRHIYQFVRLGPAAALAFLPTLYGDTIGDGLLEFRHHFIPGDTKLFHALMDGESKMVV